MTPLNIYLWQQVDKISGPLIFLAILSTIATIVLFIMFLIYTHAAPYHRARGEDYKEETAGAEAMLAMSTKRWKIFSFLTVLLWMLVGIIPSSKTIAMMVAIPAIANSEPIQKDLPELYNIAKEALMEQIKVKTDNK